MGFWQNLFGARSVECLLRRIEADMRDWPAHHQRVDAAVDALGRLGGARAVEALAGLASRSIGNCLDDRGDAHLTTMGLNERAARELARQGAAATQAITDLLNHPNGPIRWVCIRAVGESRYPGFVLLLLAHLEREGDFQGRSAVVSALGRMRGSQAIEALLSIRADSREHFALRAEAIKALGRTRDRRAVAALIADLRDEADLVREEAAEALGLIGDPSAVEALACLARESLSVLRSDSTATVRALGAIGNEQARECLTKLARSDDSPLVREAAARAVASFGVSG